MLHSETLPVGVDRWWCTEQTRSKACRNARATIGIIINFTSRMPHDPIELNFPCSVTPCGSSMTCVQQDNILLGACVSLLWWLRHYYYDITYITFLPKSYLKDGQLVLFSAWHMGTGPQSFLFSFSILLASHTKCFCCGHDWHSLTCLPYDLWTGARLQMTLWRQYTMICRDRSWSFVSQ